MYLSQTQATRLKAFLDREFAERERVGFSVSFSLFNAGKGQYEVELKIGLEGKGSEKQTLFKRVEENVQSSAKEYAQEHFGLGCERDLLSMSRSSSVASYRR